MSHLPGLTLRTSEGRLHVPAAGSISSAWHELPTRTLTIRNIGLRRVNRIVSRLSLSYYIEKNAGDISTTSDDMEFLTCSKDVRQIHIVVERMTILAMLVFEETTPELCTGHRKKTKVAYLLKRPLLTLPKGQKTGGYQAMKKTYVERSFKVPTTRPCTQMVAASPNNKTSCNTPIRF